MEQHSHRMHVRVRRFALGELDRRDAQRPNIGLEETEHRTTSQRAANRPAFTVWSTMMNPKKGLDARVESLLQYYVDYCFLTVCVL